VGQLGRPSPGLNLIAGQDRTRRPLRRPVCRSVTGPCQTSGRRGPADNRSVVRRVVVAGGRPGTPHAPPRSGHGYPFSAPALAWRKAPSDDWREAAAKLDGTGRAPTLTAGSEAPLGVPIRSGSPPPLIQPLPGGYGGNAAGPPSRRARTPGSQYRGCGQRWPPSSHDHTPDSATTPGDRTRPAPPPVPGRRSGWHATARPPRVRPRPGWSPPEPTVRRSTGSPSASLRAAFCADPDNAAYFELFTGTGQAIRTGYLSQLGDGVRQLTGRSLPAAGLSAPAHLKRRAGHRCRPGKQAATDATAVIAVRRLRRGTPNHQQLRDHTSAPHPSRSEFGPPVSTRRMRKRNPPGTAWIFLGAETRFTQGPGETEEGCSGNTD